MATTTPVLPNTEVTVAVGIVAQVLSPRRYVEDEAEPEPNLAVAIVPVKLAEGRFIKFVPLP